MAVSISDQREWIEADGLGGFASGTVTGTRTRRYHALLLTATQPPAGRIVLVNGFDAWVQTPAGSFALSSQRYTPGVIHPDGARRIESFAAEPWPHWHFRLEDGTQVEQEIFVAHGSSVVLLCWRLVGRSIVATLRVRPFFSGRDYHALHHENPAFHFEAQVTVDPKTTTTRAIWHPYPGIPGTIAIANGTYTHEPTWYRNFLYAEERARGLDDTEDLASPGVLHWELGERDAVCILAAEGHEGSVLPAGASADAALAALRTAEQQRRNFPDRLQASADAYLVRRGAGMTIVAGYPWFTDWGRDTFIALRGLCLATGRLDEARAILLEWATTVSEGMLPNRFADRGGAPEFNAVDASLWYVITVHDFLQIATVSQAERRTLQGAIEAILTGYLRGTRFGIHADEDGLLAASQPGVPLTWMDAKVGDWVVTPRIGKPVEVQALWLNALRIANGFSEVWSAAFTRGSAAFHARFWNASGGYLYDVVDANHQAGVADATFRPNQIFAVGGLPFPVLDGEKARRVVDAVETRLWTPLGLRSLAPGEPGYAPRCEGGVRERDGSYHQGTAWPWLLGAFVEAWVRVRGGTAAAKGDARARFLAPLLRHLDDAGIGHISEIADGDPPYTPRGCPFQAWSLGEALRLDRVVLAQTEQHPHN